MSEPRPGVLYGVGLGPGDPDLLTLRAAALLRSLEVVAVPRSERGTDIAGAVVATFVDEAAVVTLSTPMPVDATAVGRGWRGRVAPLIAALDAGRTVGMVTDGDPSLFSTFAHAASAVRELRPQTEVVIIPGVPSFCAAAAVEARPLLVGADRLALLPASRVDNEVMCAAMANADTVVLLKAGAAIDRIRSVLDGPARGWSVRYARRIGLPGEEHRDSLDGAGDDYMSLVILRRPREATR